MNKWMNYWINERMNDLIEWMNGENWINGMNEWN